MFTPRVCARFKGKFEYIKDKEINGIQDEDNHKGETFNKLAIILNN